MPETCYLLGDWLFLSEQGLLRDEARAVEVVLTPRAVQLLSCLVEHAGEVLGRDELIGGAWTRGEVTDHALTQAIFELRQVLRGERDNAACYIQTVPKRGYRLVAPVERCANKLSGICPPAAAAVDTGSSVATASLGGGRHPWRRPVLLIVLLFLVLSLVGFFLWPAPATNESAPNALLSTQRIDVHIESTGDERLTALQYGMGGFAAYILTMRTPYSMTQFMPSDRGAVCCLNSARELRLSVERVGEADFLRARFEHRLRGLPLFDKRYPLHPLHGAMSALSADLLQALHYPRPTKPLAAPPAEDPHNAERFFMAYYLIAKGDAASLRMAHATLLQMTASHPRADLLALRGIIELVLSDLDAGAAGCWLKASDTTFDVLYQQEGTPYFAYPVVFEARAMHALYQGQQAKGRALIEQSLHLRETWSAQIVSGKLAELEGSLDEAADAYSRAYQLKPDAGTLVWITRLGLDTKLSKLAPRLSKLVAQAAGQDAGGKVR